MSDRHPNVKNVAEVPWVDRGNGKKFGARSKFLGRAAGGARLGCSWFELPPGTRSFPFHYHLANEEAIYILEGQATLRVGSREVAVGAGDYLAFPVGPEHAHQLINSGAGPLRYLCMSTMQEPEVAVYPDSKKVGVWGARNSSQDGGPLRQLHRLGETLQYFEGEDD